MKKPMPASASSAIVEDQPPLDPLRGVTTAKQPRDCGVGTCDGALKEVSSGDKVTPDDEVPFSDAAGQATKTTSGKKLSSGQMSFSSKILLCGGGSGQERESKRKEVDENNPMAQNPAEVSGGTRSRKSSRKGSKKKSKDPIPMRSLDAAKEESDPPADESSDAKEITGKTSHNSTKSCCLCWCCCCCCPG